MKEEHAVSTGHLRFHDSLLKQHTPFGSDAFGRRVEAIARFFGTPVYLIGQSLVVAAWIALNAAAAALSWDPYPFILLNLAFSLQAAYAAPLILLAQTRQADRDKALTEADAQHREALALASLEGQRAAAEHTEQLRLLLEANTRLTEQVDQLVRDISRHIAAG